MDCTTRVRLPITPTVLYTGLPVNVLQYSTAQLQYSKNLVSKKHNNETLKQRTQHNNHISFVSLQTDQRESDAYAVTQLSRNRRCFSLLVGEDAVSCFTRPNKLQHQKKIKQAGLVFTIATACASVSQNNIISGSPSGHLAPVFSLCFLQKSCFSVCGYYGGGVHCQCLCCTVLYWLACRRLLFPKI
jgi:hypothetical protein